MYIFIALLHGIPVLVTGIWSRNKTFVYIVAAIAGLIGVAFGAGSYLWADLTAISIALAACHVLVSDWDTQSRQNEFEGQEATSARVAADLAKAEALRAQQQIDAKRRAKVSGVVLAVLAFIFVFYSIPDRGLAVMLGVLGAVLAWAIAQFIFSADQLRGAALGNILLIYGLSGYALFRLKHGDAGPTGLAMLGESLGWGFPAGVAAAVVGIAFFLSRASRPYWLAAALAGAGIATLQTYQGMLASEAVAQSGQALPQPAQPAQPAQPMNTPAAAPALALLDNETLAFNQVLAHYEARYPEINPDSPDYDATLTNSIAQRMMQYRQSGMSKSEALQAAVLDLRPRKGL